MLAFWPKQQIYVSSASACGRGQPSHTLAAMGPGPAGHRHRHPGVLLRRQHPGGCGRLFLNRFEDGMKHLQKIKK